MAYNRNVFNNAMQERLQHIDKAFDGQYSKELKKLGALSPNDVAAIAPGNEDTVVYQKLLAVVQEASVHNRSEAELAQNIKALGKIAVEIAKKVPGLAKLPGL